MSSHHLHRRRWVGDSQQMEQLSNRSGLGKEETEAQLQ
jgi:hypothetical protein